MTNEMNRDGLLAEFDRARLEFEEALRRAPDAALRYKPPGEDYALGGLVVHVTDVLRRYALLVGALRSPSESPLPAPPSPTPAEDAAQIREGFGGEARGPVLESMRSAHAAFVDAFQSTRESALREQVPVTYGSSTEPFPTAPADVMGWVLDHYKEHTQQVADLISAWADASR